MALEAIVVFFLDGKQFNPGDPVPDEVVARIGSHCYTDTEGDSGAPASDGGASVVDPAVGVPGVNPPVTTGDPASPITDTTNPPSVPEATSAPQEPSGDANGAAPAGEAATAPEAASPAAGNPAQDTNPASAADGSQEAAPSDPAADANPSISDQTAEVAPADPNSGTPTA